MINPSTDSWTEVNVPVNSLAQFIEIIESNRKSGLDQAAFERLGDEIRVSGCREPLTGRVMAPHQLEPGSGLREGLVFQGVASRVRAVMLCIEGIIAQQQLTSPRIYAAEGLTNFAMRLRGLFPRFIGSEFTLDPARSEWMYPIPREDLQNLSLPDNAFDIVSTNEVLEHVPSIDKALKEIARILRPGGWHIGTVPFRFLSAESERRAEIGEDGTVVHLMEPQYHGDPMNEGGVLVFENPGWDIIERSHKAGFGDSHMRFVVSAAHGIVADYIGGVLVFCCQKPASTDI